MAMTRLGRRQWAWDERQRVGELTLPEHLPCARTIISRSQCRVCASGELRYLGDDTEVLRC